MSNIFDYIYDLKKHAQPFVLVTVVHKQGEAPQIVGAKMLVTSSGKTVGTVGGGALESAAVKKSFEVFKSKKCAFHSFNLGGKQTNINVQNTNMMCGGCIKLFFDYFGTYPNAYIFGAGHVGRAVANHLKHLEYNITLIDNREGIFVGFDNDLNTVTGNYEKVIGQISFPDDSYFIIATYGHEYDYEVLKNIYKKSCNPAYIGLLSSIKKAADITGRFISDFGGSVGLENLYTPAGLDIGGSTPDEIALSIISEMQSIRYNIQGHKHMRDNWYFELES